LTWLLIMILSSCSSSCSYLTVICRSPQRVGHSIGCVAAESGRDVRVALGLAQLGVPEDLLHDADSGALLQQERGGRVPGIMNPRGPDACLGEE
jgi:hypothetical protein